MVMAVRRAVVLALGLGAGLAAPARAQTGPAATALAAAAPSELRDTVELFSADRAALLRRYAVDYSPARRERMRRFYGEWRDRIAHVDFSTLGAEAKADLILLDNRVRYELSLLEREDRQFAEMAPWVPFARTVIDLEESRRRLETVDGAAAARALSALTAQVDSVRQRMAAPGAPGRGAAPGASPAAAPAARGATATTPAQVPGSPATAAASRATRIVALRSAQLLDNLRRTLAAWQRYYAGYDPQTTWWTADPARRAGLALERYARALRENVVGIREGEEEPVVGDPIGAEALRAELAHEMIPYTPEELVAIAEREFAWCESELTRAARDMGLGDDWRAALERVKNTFVPPGRQTDLVRDLAREAVAFVTAHDLVTVPPLADEIWRMEMMTPEQQRVSPFFLGGEVIRVSYPTDSMTNDDKLMTMRGNNPYFARATVFHELIPGHHLQGYMTDRFFSYRDAFGTPFWTEGWSLYWEMLMWDLGFARTPEERIGMLFWRSHRAARIIFSLRVQLGTMTPDEAIDFLVTRVGHERANATAEVRRSFNGSYSPLYQAAYLLGGLQFRALHAELVGLGRMTDRQFHDAVLEGGRMPVAMVRARLTGAPLTRDGPRWRFADQPGGH